METQTTKLESLIALIDSKRASLVMYGFHSLYIPIHSSFSINPYVSPSVPLHLCSLISVGSLLTVNIIKSLVIPFPMPLNALLLPALCDLTMRANCSTCRVTLLARLDRFGAVTTLGTNFGSHSINDIIEDQSSPGSLLLIRNVGIDRLHTSGIRETLISWLDTVM